MIVTNYAYVFILAQVERVMVCCYV